MKRRREHWIELLAGFLLFAYLIPLGVFAVALHISPSVKQAFFDSDWIEDLIILGLPAYLLGIVLVSIAFHLRGFKMLAIAYGIYSSLLLFRLSVISVPALIHLMISLRLPIAFILFLLTPIIGIIAWPSINRDSSLMALSALAPFFLICFFVILILGG